MRRILIYRLGSLGDTVIALPLFHLIRRVFPNAEISVLSAYSNNNKAISTESLLAGSELVQGYINYQLKLRDINDINILRKRIIEYKPDMLIYLTEPRSRFSVFRDVSFFYLCGIKSIVGAPLTEDKFKNRFNKTTGLYENETERLARCLNFLGDANLDLLENWDLNLSNNEMLSADYLLKRNKEKTKFIVLGLGTKAKSKDWGQTNWQKLVAKLSVKYSDYTLVFIGAKEEYDYCKSVGEYWNDKKVNLCGLTRPREAAAIMKNSTIFIGHDSGPMHLAASQGIPVIAIFSSRANPGIWFPYKSRCNILFNKIECQGCLLDVCPRDNECIKMTTIDEVYQRIEKILQ